MLTYEEVISMKCRLENIYSQGVELYLDGILSSPSGIVDCFVAEGSIYMPDFVINDEGLLVQVRYDKVEEIGKISKMNH